MRQAGGVSAQCVLLREMRLTASYGVRQGVFRRNASYFASRVALVVPSLVVDCHPGGDNASCSLPVTTLPVLVVNCHSTSVKEKKHGEARIKGRRVPGRVVTRVLVDENDEKMMGSMGYSPYHLMVIKLAVLLFTQHRPNSGCRKYKPPQAHAFLGYLRHICRRCPFFSTYSLTDVCGVKRINLQNQQCRVSKALSPALNPDY